MLAFGIIGRANAGRAAAPRHGMEGLRRAGQRLARGVALLVTALSALAVSAQAAPFVNPNDVRSGTLLFKAVEEGKFVPAPLVGTDVDVTVSGPTARTRVTQHYFNPTDGWIEGVYLFPMPENSAVDTLKMVIGGRVIVGEVKEKQKAKEIYEQAKAEGKKASLLEQERPNVFTNSVANIGPRETIVIQIEYQEFAKQSGGQFSLRVPLVVAPRYTPGAPIVQAVDFGGDGWGKATTPAPAPEDKPFEAPVLDPRESPPTNPVTLAVRLQAGFPLGEVKSHHHPVLMENAGDDVRLIKLGGAVPADKDFELTWEAKPGRTPEAGLFREKTAGADYLLAFVTPPAAPVADAPAPRDIVFVIDNSGSMGGPSMEQAKNSLLYALKRLKPADRFNVVRFDDTMEELFPALVPADGENTGKALAFVSGLQASGGTEMVQAMRAALRDADTDRSRLRQVVFLTDGAISNETELFDAITAGLGRSRVFMVGIGSAPNAYLMTRAAELGRGGYSYIGSATQVEERMRTLFGKLEKPAVTDLAVKFSESGADITPKVMPDLYAGEPLTLAAKLASASGTVTISGMIGNRPWTVTLPVDRAAEGKGISKSWARARIADAEVGLLLGKTSKAEADRRILDLALEHGLLTRVTSLVAVDKTPSRPDGEPLARADIPLNLPAGWDFDKVFGESKRGSGAPALNMPGQDEDSQPLLRDASLVKAIAVSHQPTSATAAAKAKAAQQTASVSLPKTATDAATLLWRGFLLLLASVALALLALRRRHLAG
jgi:Ca-activated chloride channel family protein